MIHATQQRVLWEYIKSIREQQASRLNEVGPFFLDPDEEVIARDLDCPNYDACLSHAANKLWPSYTCDGCRRVKGRSTIEETVA